MRTRIGALALVLAWTCAPAPAQTPPPNVYRSLEAGKPVHAVGEIRGRIVSVDYPAGTIVVDDGKRRRVVAVLPSTSIEKRGQYATLSDLRAGQHVEISAYEVSGHLVAQTIRL